jgi:YaiO family outer membrane protein
MPLRLVPDKGDAFRLPRFFQTIVQACIGTPRFSRGATLKRVDRKRSCRRLRRLVLPVLGLALTSGLATAQEEEAPVSPGSAVPGIFFPGIGGSHGFVEAGGGHSSLTPGNPSWTDGYFRALFAGQANTVQTEVTREDRYGDRGWYVTGGLTHIFSQNWYGDVFVGGSSRCFFLPKYRVDGFIHRKLLPHKQLVIMLGSGYEKAKDVHSAVRLNPEANYYLRSTWVLQSGIIWTRGDPGGILVHTQYFAVTQGQNKSHFISLRGEWGREAWELIGPTTVLENFPIQDVVGTWRQWLAPNFGFNLTVEHYNNFIFNRLGATAGVFLDF